MIKVKDHCHATGKYRGVAHTDCNVKVSLNYNTTILFNNLNNYAAHIIMQELGKFDFKTNVIPNRLEKFMSFVITGIHFNNKKDNQKLKHGDK